ncbi:MAG: peptidoglycan-associated lipoprotein Pal [bacterium]
MRNLGLLGVVGLALLALLVMSCGGPKEVPVEEPVEITPVDTTPVVVEEPPPPPPKPELKVEQLKTVYFDFDKYNLRADAKAALDANYELLAEFGDVIVKIEGHCDERGTVEYNMSLGEKRAKAVMEYLVGRGIAGSRLSVISYGKEKPKDPGHNEAAWGKNRRGEFRIVSQ